MTTFVQFYSDGSFIKVSMDEMESLINDSLNKDEISDYIYERLYTRFLKIFDYRNSEEKTYLKEGGNINKNKFNEEYKNGFLQMAACSLLIETLAAFLTGNNETPSYQSKKQFNKVFEYAKSKSNSLEMFANGDFYKKIRCGILHQGETKGKYKITRKKDSDLFKDEVINAYLFHKELKELIKSYRDDLKESAWDGELWDACRMKIRFIINNAK